MYGFDSLIVDIGAISTKTQFRGHHSIPSSGSMLTRSKEVSSAKCEAFSGEILAFARSDSDSFSAFKIDKRSNNVSHLANFAFKSKSDGVGDSKSWRISSWISSNCLARFDIEA
uniref:Uncharacterized protein n=1 Tax=Romanomermis culicivorax TaxID=13658 RepID=A0A915IDK2_ROMCU